MFVAIFKQIDNTFYDQVQSSADTSVVQDAIHVQNAK